MRVNKYLIGMLTVLILASLACGITDTLISKATGGNDNYQTVTTLWSDVPQMDGLTPSTLDMPPFVKLAVRFVLGNLGRLNGQGQDQTTGNINWIAFTTAKTPQDVQNFYTNDLMVSNGWDSSTDSPCLSGSQQGTSQVGVMCAFTKTQNGNSVQLGIITVQDDKTKQTTVFYLRLEEAATPVPAATP